jgi:hypothetical protein
MLPGERFRRPWAVSSASSGWALLRESKATSMYSCEWRASVFCASRLIKPTSVHLGHENTRHPSWTKRAGGAQILDALNTHLVESAEPMFPRKSILCMVNHVV